MDSRLRQALGASLAARKGKKPISLPRVSFVDDEKVGPEISTNSDGWDGWRDE